MALTQVAERSGWTIVQTFQDAGVSGGKGRDQRPGLDGLLKAVARKEVDIVCAWSVDRLGRSLPDLITFLGELQAHGCDLFLHQQALDTSTPSGRMMFAMLGVFAEFERALIRARVMSGLERARAKGVRIGRPPVAPIRLKKIEEGLRAGLSIRVVAKATGVSSATVQRVRQGMTKAAIERTEPSIAGHQIAGSRRKWPHVDV